MIIADLAPLMWKDRTPTLQDNRKSYINTFPLVRIGINVFTQSLTEEFRWIQFTIPMVTYYLVPEIRSCCLFVSRGALTHICLANPFSCDLTSKIYILGCIKSPYPGKLSGVLNKKHFCKCNYWSLNVAANNHMLRLMTELLIYNPRGLHTFPFLFHTPT